MRIILAALVVAVYSDRAAADVLACFFTEPWITTYFDTDAATMTVHENSRSVPDLRISGLSLNLFQKGMFEVREITGRTVQHIEMNFKGSDGSSDIVYPYDVFWTTRKLRGGCTSSHLQSVPKK